MSELQTIQTVLARAARRRRWQRAWDGFWRGLFAGAAVWLLALAAYKLLPLPISVVVWGGVAALAAAAMGLAWGGWRPVGLLPTARWVDTQRQLRERLSTALEIGNADETGDWQRLLLADAVQHVKELNVAQLLPHRLPQVCRWTVLVLAVGAGLGFVPEYRSKARLEKQREAALIKDTGRHLAALTKHTLEHRPPALEASRHTLDAAAELGEQLARAQLTRTDALRELNKLTDQLKEQAKALDQSPALRRLEQAARTRPNASGATSSDLQKQIESLQKSLGERVSNPEDLAKLQQALQQARATANQMADAKGANADAAREQLARALQNLAQSARDLGLTMPQLEEAIAALAGSQIDKLLKDLKGAQVELEKLKSMAEALKQLQQQAEKVGKDLPEQLENGQAEAAQSSLQRMIDQLKQESAGADTLKSILDEVSRSVKPAEPYGEVRRHLEDAAQRLQQGDKPQAAASLAAALKELQSLQQQMNDAQSLMAGLETLQRAGQCLSTCQGWGSCLGPPKIGKGGKPGRGVGTWADDNGWTYSDPSITDFWDNSGLKRPDETPRGQTDRGEPTLSDALTPTKVRGQMSPGGPMPSITLRGVSIKGQSTIAYQEAATAAQSDAESALSQERVPRAYQNAVKDYFDDLKK